MSPSQYGSFAELCAATNFSFLRGAAHPEEIVLHAKNLGLAGLGVADRNTLAGVVRAHAAAKEADMRLAVGARLVFRDGTPDILVYPRKRTAYARLTKLLTTGNRRAPKGECWLDFEDFLDHSEGLQAIVAPALTRGAVSDENLRRCLGTVRAGCGDVWLAARFVLDGEDRRRLRILQDLARQTSAKLIATTEPLYHTPERRPLHDVLTCIREKTTLEAAGRLLAANAERHLKSSHEMMRLYAEVPGAVEEALSFLAGIKFSLDELSYQYPDESVTGYPNAQTALDALSWQGAARRYPQGIPEKVHTSLSRELNIVKQLNYAPYFLTVADIVRYAREERGILCQGRGSAANSTICYCLGITEVDPAQNQLLFDRFLSTKRNEPPDIDVDFEHERREEVIQYVYKKYGRHRAALAATLICYRRRSAIREVGKVFGLSGDCIATLSKTVHWWSKGVSAGNLRALGLKPDNAYLMACIKLAHELEGFPRHLSQHVGGFVITRGRLDDIVPIQNAAMEDRTVVEWSKDDLDELKILKVDLLGLGMLSCLRKAFEMVEQHYPDWTDGPRRLDLSTLPKEDVRVYEMLKRADSIGVFQVESRAQMSMLPRLRPEKFYDLVIEVAIVRPGPIQGGMVHPYLKRKQGLECVTYPSKELEVVLERTLGVPLFQEQAMQIAIVAAGFTPPEADRLRRAMATFRRVGTIGRLREKFISGMIANGYERDFAESVFAQIEGFGEYGFPESHAASFALLVYASSWVKCHYPDVFAAALLNAQPMGFYSPSEIVRDAGEHGVEVRPPDVNFSAWDNVLEDGLDAAQRLHKRHAEMKEDVRTRKALRLGFRQISGLREEEMKALVAARGKGYDSIRDIWLRGGAFVATIEKLAAADAFRSLGLDRRDALWAARGLNRIGGQEDLPLFQHMQSPVHQADFIMPPMTLGEHMVEDYRTLHLSLKAHPTALLRGELKAQNIVESERLADMKNGARVRVAGLVLVRQRPGTASGVVFMTLQDETHIANIIVWPRVLERYRVEVLGARLCIVDGVVQNESNVVHVVAERLTDASSLLAKLSDENCAPAPAHADKEYRFGVGTCTQPGMVHGDFSNLAQTVMPKGRNFH